jgi:methylated-DNA-protein-cysteine methyltransferase-like protein
MKAYLFQKGLPMSPFKQQVYELVSCIPSGKVISYGQIARALGKPRGAREVGWAMHGCPEELPWQRVVMADGAIAAGGYAGIRRSLLEKEGITFKPDGKVNMKLHTWLPDEKTP